MANQILAGAVFNAGQVIAGVDADNPPYVGPPIPTYLMARVAEGNRTSGTNKYLERLYLFDVYDIDADPIIIHNPNGSDTDPWGGYSDRFGESVVASNHTQLFISADYEDLGGFINQGVVYAYDKSDLTTPVATLTEPSPQEYGYFGNSIAANDTHLFVSARGRRQIYVYDVSDLSAAPTIITDTRPTVNTQYDFGRYMSANDNHLVIGDEAYNDNSSPNSNYGNVSIYDLSDLSSPIVHLTDQDLQGNCDYMGLRISNDGSQIYVGVNASYNPDNSTNHYGQMQIRDITTGNLVSTINYPSPNNDWSAFASQVVETNDKFIISAMLEKVGSDNQQGRVYVYDKSNLSSPSQIITAPLSNNTDQGSDRFGASMVSDGDYLYVSDRGSAGAGSVYQVWNAAGSYIWKYDLSDLSATPYRIDEPNVDRSEHVQEFSTRLHMVQFPFPPPPAPPAPSFAWQFGDNGSSYATYEGGSLSHSNGDAGWTIEFWANTDGVNPGNDNLIEFSNGHTIAISGWDGGTEIMFRDGGSGDVNMTWDGQIWQEAGWNHWAIVKSPAITVNGNPTASVDLYLNGVKQGGYGGSYGHDRNYGTTGTHKIGAFFGGMLFDFRISSAARYSADFTPPAAAFISDADTELLTLNKETLTTATPVNITPDSDHPF